MDPCHASSPLNTRFGRGIESRTATESGRGTHKFLTPLPQKKRELQIRKCPFQQLMPPFHIEIGEGQKTRTSESNEKETNKAGPQRRTPGNWIYSISVGVLAVEDSDSRPTPALLRRAPSTRCAPARAPRRPLEPARARRTPGPSAPIRLSWSEPARLSRCVSVQ